jgi:hypothetical protein
MMSSAIRVECILSDCTYYTPCSEKGLCMCTHPEKKYHLIEEVCPLYRLDWAKSKSKADDIRKRFGIAQKKK